MGKLAPIPYAGSKKMALKFILPHLPHTPSYIEPFCGSGVVFFNKRRSPHNVLNDRDGNIVNFMRVLRDDPDELIRRIALTPRARDEVEACRLQDATDPIERARQTWAVLCFTMQRTTDSDLVTWLSRIKCWKRARSQPLGDVKQAIDCAGLLSGVIIENMDAVKLIQSVPNDSDRLIYCDPPYHHDTRITKRLYPNEYSEDDHRRLLTELLAHDQCRIAISGYRNELYETMLKGWHSVTGTVQCGMANLGKKAGSKPREEVLWMNYDVGAKSTIFAD